MSKSDDGTYVLLVVVFFEGVPPLWWNLIAAIAVSSKL
jgi:hypothetical protein